MTRQLARTALAAAVTVLAGLIAACSPTATASNTYPPASATPNLEVSAAVTQTRASVADALGTVGLTLRDVETPYRPAEAPLLAGAPRAVYQVVLPESPDKGFIVIYEFRDAGRATEAALEQANYLATGPGRSQWPLGTQHVIRGVGTTVVVYDWLPGSAADPKTPAIATALETVGQGFPVPG